MNIPSPRFILGSLRKVPSLLSEMSLGIKRLCCAFRLIKAVNREASPVSHHCHLCSRSKSCHFMILFLKIALPPKIPLAAGSLPPAGLSSSHGFRRRAARWHRAPPQLQQPPNVPNMVLTDQHPGSRPLIWSSARRLQPGCVAEPPGSQAAAVSTE